MPTDTADAARLAAALDALRAEVAKLGERVAALEANGAKPAAVAPAPAPPPQEAVSEELVLVIGAAVAAFLGVKARVRQIRLLRADAWAQQGRMTIQASHKLG